MVVVLTILPLDVVFLVHEVVLLAVHLHVVLADGLDLRVAIHLGLVGEALIRIGRHAVLEADTPQDLAKERVQRLADAVARPLLEFARDGVDLDTVVPQDDEHVRDDRVRVIVLIPVGLQLQELQAPHHQALEVLKLRRWIRSRIHEVRARHGLQLLGAELRLVVQQHEHVNNLIVELERLGVRGDRALCWCGRAACGSSGRHPVLLRRAPRQAAPAAEGGCGWEQAGAGAPRGLDRAP
mmetsp:Transcript_54074/g.74230  ORF Transcript_54074/g.74230 Transcript_54074/m.74230 type:complete len:239 (-) Transcript_54074:8-724(-)